MKIQRKSSKIRNNSQGGGGFSYGLPLTFEQVYKAKNVGVYPMNRVHHIHNKSGGISWGHIYIYIVPYYCGGLPYWVILNERLCNWGWYSSYYGCSLLMWLIKWLSVPFHGLYKSIRDLLTWTKASISDRIELIPVHTKEKNSDT